MQEDLLGTKVKKVTSSVHLYFLSTPQSGATRIILVTAPKLQEDWGGTITGNVLSLLADIPLLCAARIILVTAPKLQEDWIDTKVISYC